MDQTLVRRIFRRKGIAVKTGFFQESPGVYSSMRLMSFIALLAALWFGHLTIRCQNPETGIYITSMFLIAAFAPKTISKFVESRNGLNCMDKENTDTLP